MTDIFLGPKRYVQRPGALADAGAELKAFGRRPMILGDELVLSILRPDLEKNLRSAGLSACFVLFGVECSLSEVARVADIGRFDNVDVIVGTGGGKAIDTARAVAGRLDLPLVTLPTSAATCSAASTVSVIYENGIRTDTIHGKAAELVLVDSAIVAAAPSRLLAAGMGDTLAKWLRSWGFTAWRCRFSGKVSVGPVPREAPPTTCPFRSTRRAFCAPSRKLRKG
jgi:glycerol dehydrogenase